MKAAALLLALLLGTAAAEPRGNAFRVVNGSGERLVAVIIEPADGGAAPEIFGPVPNGGILDLRPSFGDCRIIVRVELPARPLVILTPFDACAEPRLVIRHDDIRPRFLPGAPSAPPQIEPRSPWGIDPPGSGILQ